MLQLMCSAAGEIIKKYVQYLIGMNMTCASAAPNESPDKCTDVTLLC